MAEIQKNDYGVMSFNIKDSVGQFTYKVRLSDRIDFDPNTGFLYCKDAIVGNVGVQTYTGYELGFADGNRIVKVHRTEKYIFASESLESLRGKPITLEHPTEMVDSKNIKKYGMGTILDVGKRDGDNIIVDLVIQDKALIDKVAPEDENGERKISSDFRDLSLGYSAKLLAYQDTNEFVQTNIEYNHLAVVKEGRAANALIRDNQNEELKEAKVMTLKERIKGLFFKKNTDNTVTVLDEEGTEEKIVSIEESHETKTFQDPFEHDKKITVVSESKTVVTEKDGKDAEIEKEEEKGEKKTMKDKAYFDSAMKEALALPDGAYKDGKIQDINEDYLATFPKKILDAKPIVVIDSALKDLKVVDSDKINKTFKDEEPKKADFAYMEKESKDFYDKLTNPESGAHKDHQAWSDNYNQVVRSGRTNLNL
jgi:hypothetical protein